MAANDDETGSGGTDGLDLAGIANIISSTGTAFSSAWRAANPPSPGQYVLTPGGYVYATGQNIPITQNQVLGQQAGSILGVPVGTILLIVVIGLAVKAFT